MDDYTGLNVHVKPREFKYREKKDTEYMGRTAYEHDPQKQYGPEAVEREQTYNEEAQNRFLESAANRMGEDAYLQGIVGDLTRIREQVDVEKTEFQRDYSNFLTEQLELDESKYRGKDGKEMREVKREIKALTTFLHTPIPEAERPNLPMHVVNLEKQYDTVIRCCEVYEATHNPWFATGKRRLRMVRDMKEFCKKERAMLSPALDQFLESNTQGDITWGDILYNVRAITIDSANIQRVKGGAVSDVHKVSLDGGQTFKYLSYETSTVQTDFYSRMTAGIEKYREETKPVTIRSYAPGFEIMERLQKASKKRSPEELEFASRQILELAFGDKTWSIADYKRLPEWIKNVMPIDVRNKTALSGLKGHLMAFAARYIKGAEALNPIVTARIHLDAVVSRRNVATSRVASMLGMDDIVKKSRTVLVRGEDGKLERANLMDEASGITMDALRKRAEKEKKKIAYSSDAIRQLVRLEIFDMICGQTDRHKSNYNVNVEEHDDKLVVTGIQVFDNDMAFGDLCFNDIRRGVSSMGGLFFKKNVSKTISAEIHHRNQMLTHETSPVDGESLLFEHMDKELYEKIIELDNMSEFLVLQLVELGINQAEIEALKDRIKGVRQALFEAAYVHKKDGKLPYLLDRDQWQQMDKVSDVQPENDSSAKINHDRLIEEALWKQK